MVSGALTQGELVVSAAWGPDIGGVSGHCSMGP